MQITSIEIANLNVALKHPISTPLGALDAARNVVVKIITDSGIFGWGEASPFAPITGDSQESNHIAAQQLARLLLGRDPLAIEVRMAEINAFTTGEPSVRSAFDMALYDIAAKAAGLPLYRFLGGERREIRTDLTIGIQSRVEDTLALADKTLAAGFNAIKLKVGRPGLVDVDHVAAVRELAGPDVAIKIDSNQGWDFPTAVANLRAMQDLGVEYSEQPLAAWDIGGLARLRDRVNLPICADESLFTHCDALKLLVAGAADYLNIKLGKAGGIHMGLRINAIAEAAGASCMIGCFAESRLGMSAAAHLAMARPNIRFLDLDTAYQFAVDPVGGGVRYDDTIGGLMHLPDTPGHGAEIDERHLQRLCRIAV
ncbi:mandelate racemase/muconate lactonizing enzyme family protein [Microbulbifer taiwanensis]|uniref:Dipeptide epimerase n=1 Tax=Microbulbifer taiwanensis TaxID=986746 RepID=A0ABW1YJA0_9GAMM|nr:dipeptide epimerase [Microbulbifer taiwanensis]